MTLCMQVVDQYKKLQIIQIDGIELNNKTDNTSNFNKKIKF